LQKLIEAKEKNIKEDNSYIFKRFTSHNPPVYDTNPTPRPLRIGFGVWRSCLMLYNALRSGK